MKTLPPPPVPQKLREMLKDYPQYLDELQGALNRLVENPKQGVPVFDQAIWRLEAVLTSFISEARDELKVAESAGDPEIIRKAEEKVRLMLHASQLRRLHELKDYFDENKESVG
ncbi:hypothetical protein [Xanthomonas sp. LMG 12461]|uniref:hypothetical protein n=1 Tax=Xanthomonas sp. LMG 12461 TaxID=2014543 RepID=UPI001D04A4A0|nr:hypothetical protein [Xanthomonas sp. LMG 12461]